MLERFSIMRCREESRLEWAWRQIHTLLKHGSRETLPRCQVRGGGFGKVGHWCIAEVPAPHRADLVELDGYAMLCGSAFELADQASEAFAQPFVEPLTLSECEGCKACSDRDWVTTEGTGLVTGPSGARLRMTSRLPAYAAAGRPPPMTLPKQVRSGRTFAMR